MIKFLKGLLLLFWTGVSILIIYFFWTGVLPERIKATPSPEGIKPEIRVTQSRGWKPCFKTTLILTTPSNDRFIYYLGKQGDRKTLFETIDSMAWTDEYTLSIENQANGKKRHYRLL